MNIIRSAVRRMKRLAVAEPPVVDVPLDSINMARLLYYKNLLDLTRNVPGDIVECGVGHARSLLTMSLLVKVQGDHRNIWGFDSFEGFPEPSLLDESPRSPKRGEYAVSLPLVSRTLHHYIADEQFVHSRITLVQGYFEATLSRFPGDAISLLNLDVDLHDSYKICLETMWPRVSVGGIATFDEYIRESHVFPGAERAIRDFFHGKPAQFDRDPNYGKYYVVKLA